MGPGNGILSDNHPLTKYASKQAIEFALKIFDDLRSIQLGLHLTPNEFAVQSLMQASEQWVPQRFVQYIKGMILLQKMEFIFKKLLSTADADGAKLGSKLLCPNSSIAIAQARLGHGIAFNVANLVFMKFCQARINAYYFDCGTHYRIEDTVEHSVSSPAHNFVIFGDIDDSEFNRSVNIGDDVLVALKRLGKGIIHDYTTMKELVPVAQLERHPAAKEFVKRFQEYKFTVVNPLIGKKFFGLTKPMEESEMLYQLALPLMNEPFQTPYLLRLKAAEHNFILRTLQNIFNYKWLSKESSIWTVFDSENEMYKALDYFAAHKIPVSGGKKGDKFFVQLKPKALDCGLFNQLPTLSGYFVLRTTNLKTSLCTKIILNGEISHCSPFRQRDLMYIIDSYLVQ